MSEGLLVVTDDVVAGRRSSAVRGQPETPLQVYWGLCRPAWRMRTALRPAPSQSLLRDPPCTHLHQDARGVRWRSPAGPLHHICTTRQGQQGSTRRSSDQHRRPPDLRFRRSGQVRRPRQPAFTRQRSGDRDPHRPPGKCSSGGSTDRGDPLASGRARGGSGSRCR